MNTVEEAKWRYKIVFLQLQAAEKEAEDLRPNCLDHYKKFHNKIKRCIALSIETNIARRKMIDLMEGQWYER